METRGIAEGMGVRASDGKKVGTVIECRTDGFVIEKGIFFPRDYAVAYGEVQEVTDGEVHLSRASDELERVGRGRDEEQRSTGEAPPAGKQGEAAQGAAADLTAATSSSATARAAASEQVEEQARVPLASEEVEARTHQRESGEVRVRKDVVTEQKELSVPVTREEVRVEHAPVQGAQPAGEGTFEEKTVAIPVREDEVEIRKRPVVREEVRVSKVRQHGEQRADAEVRHEEARVERSPDSLEPGPSRGEPKSE